MQHTWSFSSLILLSQCASCVAAWVAHYVDTARSNAHLGVGSSTPSILPWTSWAPNTISQCCRPLWRLAAPKIHCILMSRFRYVIDVAVPCQEHVRYAPLKLAISADSVHSECSWGLHSPALAVTNCRMLLSGALLCSQGSFKRRELAAGLQAAQPPSSGGWRMDPGAEPMRRWRSGSVCRMGADERARLQGEQPSAEVGLKPRYCPHEPPTRVLIARNSRTGRGPRQLGQHRLDT
jgi:hypothetical protein